MYRFFFNYFKDHGERTTKQLIDQATTTVATAGAEVAAYQRYKARNGGKSRPGKVSIK